MGSFWGQVDLGHTGTGTVGSIGRQAAPRRSGPALAPGVGVGDWPEYGARVVGGRVTTVAVPPGEAGGVSLQPSYLQLICDEARLLLDDPRVGKRYTDTEILRITAGGMRAVVQDLAAVTSRPLVLMHDVPVNTTDLVYYLPPSIGEVLRFGEFDYQNNTWKWVLRPVSRWNSAARSIRLEGRRLRLETKADRAFTLTIEYIPSGDYFPHEGYRTFAPGTLGPGEFALLDRSQEAVQLVRGYVDDRPGAYVGSVLRVWRLYPAVDKPSVVQERIVTAYTPSESAPVQRKVTVETPFDPAIVQDGTSVYQYEVVPIFWEGVRAALTQYTAFTLASIANQAERAQALHTAYRLTVRQARVAEINASPDGQTWESDTDEAWENARR